MMGKNGSEEWLKECPTHLTTPDNGGSTSVDSMSSLTLDWIVCVSLTFLRRVL